MGGPASSSVETVLLALLIQLIVIITVARLFGKLFRRIGQPQVCGEIAAGLILGPSFFGKLAPGIFEHIFTSSVVPIFSVLSQLGLILLMFMVGLELDLTHLLTKGRTAIDDQLCRHPRAIRPRIAGCADHLSLGRRRN